MLHAMLGSVAASRPPDTGGPSGDAEISVVSSLVTAVTQARSKVVALSSTGAIALTKVHGALRAVAVSASSTIDAYNIDSLVGGPADASSTALIDVSTLRVEATPNIVVSTNLDTSDDLARTAVAAPFGTTGFNVGSYSSANGRIVVPSPPSGLAFTIDGTFSTDDQWLEFDWVVGNTTGSLLEFGVNASVDGGTNRITGYLARVSILSGDFVLTLRRYTSVAGSTLTTTYLSGLRIPTIGGTNTLRLKVARFGPRVFWYMNDILAEAWLRDGGVHEYSGGRPFIYSNGTVPGSIDNVTAGYYSGVTYDATRNTNPVVTGVTAVTSTKSPGFLSAPSMSSTGTIVVNAAVNAPQAVSTAQLNDDESTIAVNDGDTLDLTNSTQGL